MRAAALLAIALAAPLAGQTFTQRGFFESRNYFFPQTGFNDSGRAVSELLLRYDAAWQARPWLRFNTSFDTRIDSHRQVERAWTFDWDGRQIQRPPFSFRRFSAILNRKEWTFEIGRQFIRWGKADILNPTDRFAPRDFLNVFDADFLAVNAARLTWERGGNTIDAIWQPRFTPSRTPLLLQRWLVLPEVTQQIRVQDRGSRYPGGSQYGIRWNHVGRGYEFSLSYFDGNNYYPLFQPSLDIDFRAGLDAIRRERPPLDQLLPVFARNAITLGLERTYPRLRLYGGDAAVPLKWFTVKGEAGYYTSSTPGLDSFLLYVIQLERTWGEWVFVGGYAGEALAAPNTNPLSFLPDRGVARSFIGRAAYTIGPTSSFNVDAVVRGGGSWIRFEYSRAFGQHWRATGGFAWIRGRPDDFIGQYDRNSNASLAIRYSF